MAISGNTVYPYGLRELKVKNGSTLVSAPAAQTLKFKEKMTNAVLRGNDGDVVVSAFVDGVEWELSSGGYPMEFIAALTGRTVAGGGSGSDETMTMTITKGDVMPYVTIYGKIMGDAGDDIHVKIFKAKVTEGVDGTFQDGAFFVSAIKGMAVGDPDNSNKITDVVRNETATALPTS
jgi:hypothetical protein